MGKYNFDIPIDRKNTYSEKWDNQAGDLIPLWVADMDFKSPDQILNAIQKRVDHGVFGYSRYQWELTDVIVGYYKKYYNFEIDAKWIVWVSSVMPGANLACRVAGGEILYNTPIYSHIRILPHEVYSPYQEIPLIKIDDKYTFDWKRMEQEVREDVKAFILCNPHNPVGRVYSREELQRLSDFCKEHKLILISDEIHSQLIFEGTHIPAFMINEWAKQNSITLTSPAKTYNIPSLPFAFAIIPNPEIRKAFINEEKGLLTAPNVLTIQAVKTAYTQCDDWRKALLIYLKKNRDDLEKRVTSIPGLMVNHNEATYLSWIDARGLNVEDPWLYFREKAGVNFSNGVDFGCPGFLRVNFGCTKALLEKAMDRIEKSVKALKA